MTPTPTVTNTPTNTDTTTDTATPTITSTPTVTSTPTLTFTPIPNPIVLGTSRVIQTYNSLAVEVQFSGDDSESATVQLQFKKHTDATWRNGLPYGMWGNWTPTDGGSRAFYQSIVQLDPATPYDVQITFSDPNGIVGINPVLLSATTDMDAIADPSTLVADHFVDSVNGNDVNNGTSAATAWKTLSYAWANAPSGAVVQLASGYYAAPANNPTGARTLPITLIGAVSPVQVNPVTISGETWQETDVANIGQHAVIDSGVYTSPTGSGDLNAGVWASTVLTDTYTGQTFTNIWKWTAPVGGIQVMGYNTTRASQPQHVANWIAYPQGLLSTPENFAGQVNLSKMERQGFWQGPGKSNDIYLRLPQDVNPNTVYITLGTGDGLQLNGPNQRVSQIEIRDEPQGITVESGVINAIIDHVDIEGDEQGIELAGIQSSGYGNGATIQYNRLNDTNLWVAGSSPGSGNLGLANTAAGIGVAGPFVKGGFYDQNGIVTGLTRVGQASETHAINGNGSPWRTTIRFNTFDGYHDDIPHDDGGSFNRYSGWLTDIHDNIMRHSPDDAIEPDRAISWNIWHNRMEYNRTTLALVGPAYGPIVYWKNQAWKIGVSGFPPALPPAPSTDGGGMFIKFGNSDNPPVLIYYINNTEWSDVDGTAGQNGIATDTSGPYASGGRPFVQDAFYFRNNDWRSERYGIQTNRMAVSGNGQQLNEDYDQWTTPDMNPQHCVNYGTINYTIAAYQAASGQGLHTDVTIGCQGAANTASSDAALVNVSTGDLRTVSGSPLVGTGTQVSGLMDRPGIDFQGNMPNIGEDVTTQ